MNAQQGMSPRIRIYDNGGKTADRYSIFINDDVWDLSENANLPNGVCMFAGSAQFYDKPSGWSYPARRIPRRDLAEGAEIALRSILKEYYAGGQA